MASRLATLLKPRIVALLVFVALAAAFLGADGTPDLVSLVWLALTGSMAAGGAGALNHYLERDLDARMERTRQRPLVLGGMAEARLVLGLGLALVGFAAAMTLPFNAAQGVFLLAGAFVYVVVYTMWLKRRSPWNIVIGGLAGSCAVLTGWATVGPWFALQPLLLALLLFLWTPPHFWSLAIVHLDDYRRASVPMLPVAVGTRTAALWGLLHVVLLVGVSFALAETATFGTIYRVVALAVAAALIGTALRQVWLADRESARLHFGASILYLAAIFTAMGVDRYVQSS